MEFSNEVLAQILSQASDHQRLSLVCPRFHEISCEYKLCGMRIRGTDAGWEVKHIDCYFYDNTNKPIDFSFWIMKVFSIPC